MKIEVWTDPMRPPEGFKLSPPPEDFGVGRSATLGNMIIGRGDAVATLADGSKVVLPVIGKINTSAALELLREAGQDGVTFG